MYLPIQLAQLNRNCHCKFHDAMALGSAKELGLLRHGRSNHILPDGFVIKVDHLNLSMRALRGGSVLDLPEIQSVLYDNATQRTPVYTLKLQDIQC